jgi:agmatinase
MQPPFDPGAAALPGSGIFGLPHGPEAGVSILGVPFQATTSYRRGTAHGPEAVLAASRQVELDDLRFGRPYEAGLHMLPIAPEILAWDEEASAAADPIIAAGGALGGDTELARGLGRVNAIGAELNAYVERHTHSVLEAGRLPVVLGGDHSVPFGALAACAECHPGLGVLHFDAHADLRRAYEGFTWSHASILFNVLEHLEGVQRVVQVGVRDLCAEEHARIAESEGRVHTLFDPDWARARFAGEDLPALVRATIEKLPEEVYVTFDVDGLDPSLCPGTGTPVPGGLGWHEAMLWLEELAASGRRVVGLDLCEVSPGPDSAGDSPGHSWDAVVGARLLYRLIGAALVSRRR